MPIHLDPEDAWRKGLETGGTHWVTAELARLPGRPGDPLFDVVFVPPHPSRAFCQRWCAEEENRIRVTPTTLLALNFVILALICVGRAAVLPHRWPSPTFKARNAPDFGSTQS